MMADDIYEKIYWANEPFGSLAQVVPGLYPRTITINGCSKGYAMTDEAIENSASETVWCSPHCMPEINVTGDLFAEVVTP